MKKGFFNSLTLITLTCSFSLAQTAVTVAPQGIHASPPGSQTTAGYFSLSNPTQRSLTLQNVQCLHPAVSRCELHETIHHGHQQHMQKSSLTLAAGEQRSLTSGGLHLMLWLTEPLTTSDKIEIILSFDNAPELAFTLPVLGLPTHENH